MKFFQNPSSGKSVFKNSGWTSRFATPRVGRPRGIGRHPSCGGRDEQSPVHRGRRFDSASYWDTVNGIAWEAGLGMAGINGPVQPAPAARIEAEKVKIEFEGSEEPLTSLMDV